MSSVTVYDSLIIGAGISGLSLAHHCVRGGLSTLVLEREPRVGGCMQSHVFPEADGFWTELGAHTCYNSYGHLLDLVAELGLADALLQKEKVPFRLLAGDGLRSVVSGLRFLELARSLPRLFTAGKAGHSVAEYYSRVLGERNYRDLFAHAFNAVICQPAGEFPADLLFRRKPRRKGFPRSFTLADGLGAIPAAAAAQPGLELLTGHEAAAVDRSDDLYRVTLADGRAFRSRRLGLAVPPDAAAGLLAGIEPALAEALAEIGMAAIESVSVVVARDALSLAPLAGIIAPDDDFFSAVSRDYLPDRRYRGFTFHFRPGRLDRSGQLERIARVLGVAQDRFLAVAGYRNRLPALRAGHAERVQRLDAGLAGKPLALTGNYFLGVSIEDCLTRTASEFRRLIGG